MKMKKTFSKILGFILLAIVIFGWFRGVSINERTYNNLVSSDRYDLNGIAVEIYQEKMAMFISYPMSNVPYFISELQAS